MPPDTPLRTLAFLPGTVAPAFVAWWITRPEQRPALVDPAFKWQVPARWYLFALLYLAVIKLVAAIVYGTAKGAIQPPSDIARPTGWLLAPAPRRWRAPSESR